MEQAVFGDVDVDDFAAGFAIEMPMFAHVRAEANAGAIEDDLADEAAFDEDAEAVVNGGEGNFGVGFFGALEDLFGRRVVMAFDDDVEDLLALAGHFQTAGGQALRQSFVQLQFHDLC